MAKIEKVLDQIKGELMFFVKKEQSIEPKLSFSAHDVSLRQCSYCEEYDIKTTRKIEVSFWGESDNQEDLLEVMIIYDRVEDKIYYHSNFFEANKEHLLKQSKHVFESIHQLIEYIGKLKQRFLTFEKDS